MGRDKVKVVLIKPRFSINLGLIARAMANFDFKDLILIKPRCKPFSEKAKQFSMKGYEIIKNLKIYNSLEKLKEEGHFLIGTTRVGGRYRSKRYSPKEIIPFIETHNSPALVFGNEQRGLNKKEIRLMDCLSTIKTAEGERGSINLAIAVSIYLYEISKEEKILKSHSKEETVFHFYKYIIENLKSKNILKERDYRHGEALILELIKRANLREKEIGFLYNLIKKCKNI